MTSVRIVVFLFATISLFASQVPGRVAICGVCKDVEETMPFTVSNLEKMGGLFDDYRIFIYENNSKDRTPELLQQWAKKNLKVKVTCEIVDDAILAKSCVNKTIQNEFHRLEKIARARNIVLDQAMDPAYDDYEYVIWVDLDFAHPFPLEAITKTFHSKNDWDAVFANGVAGKRMAYFDIFAFRDHKQPFGPELLGNDWWKLGGKSPFRTWRKKMRPMIGLWDYLSIRRKHNFRFVPGENWYPVVSAFGGLGIYKRKAIQGCRYSGLATEDLETLAKQWIEKSKVSTIPQIALYLRQQQKIHQHIRIPEIQPEMTAYHDEKCGILLGTKPDGLVFRMNSGVCQYPSVCEHVPFHASMIVRGHDKLYINPDLVLYYFNR